MAIARGRHAQKLRDLEARRRLQQPLDPDRPFEKCPTCGARVQLPCVACRARRELARRGPVHVSQVLEELRHSPETGFDLRPAEQARYEEIRRRRLGGAETSGGHGDAP